MFFFDGYVMCKTHNKKTTKVFKVGDQHTGPVVVQCRWDVDPGEGSAGPAGGCGHTGAGTAQHLPGLGDRLRDQHVQRYGAQGVDGQLRGQ